MAENLIEDKVVLIKKETTYGTDPTPTGAANAILTTGFQIQPNESTRVDRNLDRPGYGASPAIMAGKNVGFGFRVEAVGSGAAGTAPAFGPVLQMGGFAEVVDAGVSVTYAPVSEDPASATMYFYQGPNLHKGLGGRAGVGFEAAALAIPYFTADGRALYVAPAAGAPTGVDYSDFLTPRPVEDAITPTFSLHSHGAVMQRLSIGAGRSPTYRNLVNQEAIRLPPRRIEGSCTIIAPAIATKDYYAAMAAETLGALSFVHGVTAGRIVAVAASLVQIVSIAHTEIDGELGLDLGLLFVASDAGDDELSFIFT